MRRLAFHFRHAVVAQLADPLDPGDHLRPGGIHSRGFRASPTPAGVPVASRSPGSSVMNSLT